MSPHDALFKTVFGQPEHARALLQAVLPAPLVALIDWTHLEVRPNESVDPALRATRADLVVETRAGEAPVALQLLLEHQSTVDDHIALRFVAYMEPVWRRARVEAPGAGLVPLIPVVIHHGAAWRGGDRFAQLYGLPPPAAEVLAPWLLDFGVLRVDLGAYPDETIFALADAAAALAWLALVVARQGDLGRLFASARGLWLRLAQAASGQDAARAVFRYILEVRPPAEREVVQAAAIEALAGKERGKMAETIAEWYREEGFREGREEGREEGRRAGRHEALVHILELQLRLKFGALPPDFAARVAAADVAELERWTLRLLTAATPTEVLAD